MVPSLGQILIITGETLAKQALPVSQKKDFTGAEIPLTLRLGEN